MENIGFLLRKPTIFFLYFRNYNLICRAFPSPKRRSPSRNSQWPKGPKRGFGNSFQPAIDAPRYYGLVWFCSRVILTANYGVKQNQFIKPTSKPSLQNQLQNPALVTLKNLIRLLTAQLENSYCSIIVINHQLITVIKFITKNYIHP